MKITVNYNHDEFIALKNLSYTTKDSIRNATGHKLDAIPHEGSSYHTSYQYDIDHITVEIKEESAIKVIDFLIKVITVLAPFYISIKGAWMLMAGHLKGAVEQLEKDLEIPEDYFRYGIIEHNILGNEVTLFARKGKKGEINVAYIVGSNITGISMSTFKTMLEKECNDTYFNMTREQFNTATKERNEHMNPEEFNW